MAFSYGQLLRLLNVSLKIELERNIDMAPPNASRAHEMLSNCQPSDFEFLGGARVVIRVSNRDAHLCLIPLRHYARIDAEHGWGRRPFSVVGVSSVVLNVRDGDVLHSPPPATTSRTSPLQPYLTCALRDL